VIFSALKTLSGMILFLLLFTTQLSASSIETIQIEVLGYGSNQQEATFEALAEAVRQVHGVDIVARRDVSSSSQELAFIEEDGSRSSLTLSADQTGRVTASSQGYISGYRILSKADRSPGIAVRLLVDLPVFKGPGMRTHETRRRLAVYPFEADSNLRLFGELVGAVDAADQLTRAVVESMTQTRRFAVLERERTRETLEERRLLHDPSVPASEKARLGATLGSDYVVIGQIEGMDIDAFNRASQLTGESSLVTEGSVVVELRILSPATRQVHWANTMTIPAEDIFSSPADATGRAAFRQTVWSTVADRITERAISAIYPLRLIERMGDQVVLNQGGSQLRQGMVLQIFELGEELFDPYSGESLGRVESPVARARVDRVTDRVSYARLIEGLVTDVDPGRYLARRDGLMSGLDSNADEQVRGSRRRVLLPQDQ
jgi:TolB-like protein